MICLESFVTWTHKTSMEVYVRIISENLKTGKRIVCATSFLTFVAIDETGKTQPVPDIEPETELEIELHNSAPERYKRRVERRASSKELASKVGAERKIPLA